MSFQKSIFAWLIYGSEEKVNRVLQEDKEELFSNCKGTILEIGAGTGSNLGYYPKKCKVICLEPNSAMHPYLRKKAKKEKLKITIITGNAESIPCKSGTFDVVVSTHVLCSVNNVENVLDEVKRVLKVSGRFVFIEHVVAEKNTLLRNIQTLLAPLWSAMMDHCQLNRDLSSAIRNCFDKVEIKRKKFKQFLFVSPHIIGVGRK